MTDYKIYTHAKSRICNNTDITDEHTLIILRKESIVMKKYLYFLAIHIIVFLTVFIGKKLISSSECGC